MQIQHNILYKIEKEENFMPENSVNANISNQSDRCCCNNNGGPFGGLFGGNGCCCGSDSEILFFIIIFLLLFTNFGCCGCNR